MNVYAHVCACVKNTVLLYAIQRKCVRTEGAHCVLRTNGMLACVCNAPHHRTHLRSKGRPTATKPDTEIVPYGGLEVSICVYAERAHADTFMHIYTYCDRPIPPAFRRSKRFIMSRPFDVLSIHTAVWRSCTPVWMALWPSPSDLWIER